MPIGLQDDQNGEGVAVRCSADRCAIGTFGQLQDMTRHPLDDSESAQMDVGDLCATPFEEGREVEGDQGIRL